MKGIYAPVASGRQGWMAVRTRELSGHGEGTADGGAELPVGPAR